MANYFLDSNALAKHYHPEIGSAKVDQLLQETGSHHFISRLSVVEMQSVFAGKVRTGVISLADSQLLRRRFRADTRAQLFSVVRMTAGHFREAERLVQTYGPSHALRTLDALQLAVARSLQLRSLLDLIVSSDVRVLNVAVAEQLAVINPEQP